MALINYSEILSFPCIFIYVIGSSEKNQVLSPQVLHIFLLWANILSQDIKKK